MGILFVTNGTMYNIKYSQNFLTNASLIKRLINMSNLDGKDLVLEVGTGSGNITKQLCRACRKVVSVEKDKRLYKRAKSRLKAFNNLKLVNEDFLQMELPKSMFKCFSNIPFSITADIIRKLLFDDNRLKCASLVMQKEAFERFGATNGKNTQISMQLAPFWKSEKLYEFKKSDFSPSPSVDTVFVEFRKRSPPKISEENRDLFYKFVKYGFNQWKEDIRKALSSVFTYNQLKRFTRDLKFSLSDKPSDLGVEHWVGMFGFAMKNRSQVKMERICF